MDLSGLDLLSSRKCVRTANTKQVGVVPHILTDSSPAPHGPEMHSTQLMDLANCDITPFRKLTKPNKGNKRSRSSSSSGCVDPGVADRPSHRHEDKADVYDHQAAIQRKLLKLECSGAQEVPASPLLTQLTDSCEDNFLSPADKKSSSTLPSEGDVATPLNLLCRETVSLPPVYDYRRQSAPRTMRSGTVKRALDFNTLLESSHPSSLGPDRCQLETVDPVRDNDRDVPRTKVPILSGGSRYSNPSRGLDVSTLLGRRTVILPDHGHESYDNSQSDRLDVSNFSLLHCMPREE